MLSLARPVRVWACAEPTNMRKSFDGLRAAAISCMDRDPLTGDMFLFVARDRKQAKVLYWDGSGLVLIAKRLLKGRFNAPWDGHREKPWCLSASELGLFLEGSPLAGPYQLLPPAAGPDVSPGSNPGS